MNWNDVAIEQLNMSVRIVNCLHEAGISTVGQMLLLDRDAIVALRNMGDKSRRELELLQKRIKAGEVFLSTGKFGEIIINESEESSIESAEDTLLERVFSQIDLTNVKRIRYVDRYGMFLDDISISDCGFSPRTENGLKRAGYNHISQVVQLREDELKEIRSFGKKCQDELIAFIANNVKLDVSGHSFNADIDAIVEQLKRQYGECAGFFDRNEVKYALQNVLQQSFSEEELQNPNLIVSSSRFMERLLSDNVVKNVVKTIIMENLKSSEWIDIRSIKLLLPSLVTNAPFFSSVIKDLCDEDKIEFQDNSIRVRYLSVDEWVQELKDNRREAVTYRLDGLTLEAAGNKMGITRERVRQLVEAALKNKPKLREDDYAYWINNYDLNIDASQYIFNISEKTYRYLTLRDGCGSKEIEEILDDEKTTKDIYIKTRDYLRLDTVKIGDKYIPKYRNLICRELAKINCSKQEISCDDFYEMYQQLLAENGLSDDERLQFPTERAFAARVEDSDYVLNRYGRKFRYYNIKECDIATLVWGLRLEQFKDVEIASFKLFNDNKYLMEEYGIVDGYELHSLLRKTEYIWNVDNSYEVSFGRMPFITFGVANRERQVRTLLFQIAPVSADDFDKQYEEEYGVFARTVAANFRKCIDEFYHDGVFEIDQPLFNENEASFMLQNLIEDFYFIDDVKDMFSDKFGEGKLSKINARTLKQLGYDVFSNYILKNTYASAREYFESILMENDRFDVKNVDTRLGYVQMFNATLNNLRESYDLIEYDEMKFIKYDKIHSISPDITKERLQVFASDLVNAAEEQFFTVKSVANDGFKLLSYELGLSEWFDASLVRASRLVRFAKTGGNIIFSKEDDSFTTIDFLRFLLRKNKSMDYFDLDDLLKDEYGISLDRNNLIYLVKESDMFYDQILDRFYLSKELYYEDL